MTVRSYAAFMAACLLGFYVGGTVLQLAAGALGVHAVRFAFALIVALVVGLFLAPGRTR